MRRATLLAVALCATIAPARATPVRCTSDPCAVQAFAAGYLAPVTEIASGQRVEWTTTEASHPTTDSIDDSMRCFSSIAAASVPPTPIRFDVTPTGLTATDPTKETPTRSCGTAVQLSNGVYLLPFRCMLHTWMNGALLVDP